MTERRYAHAQSAGQKSNLERDIVRTARSERDGKPTGGQERERLVDAQQLMKIALKILRSKVCFEAV